jgi:anti-sigma B factor antagonist
VIDSFGSPFAVTTASHNGQTRITVSGEVDIASADALRRALVEAERADDGHPIVLDLTGVTFMDSTGLRALIEHVRISSLDGDRLRICPSEQVSELLKITGLTEQLARISLGNLPDSELAPET